MVKIETVLKDKEIDNTISLEGTGDVIIKESFGAIMGLLQGIKDQDEDMWWHLLMALTKYIEEVSRKAAEDSLERLSEQSMMN